MRFNIVRIIKKSLPEKIYAGLYGSDPVSKISSRIARRKISRFKYTPKISIVVPVYNIDAGYLIKCIDSVLDQVYENWELCIVDDASDDENIKAPENQ